MQALLPVDPDEQKRILIEEAEREMRRHVRIEDVNRIKYYITEGILPHIIPSYPMEYIKLSKQKVPSKYKALRCYWPIMNSYDKEIINDYDEVMRLYLLKYILRDPYEWRRLNIQTFPPEYPVIIVRAPVTWHASFTIGKQMLFRHYFVGNPILIRVHLLWEEK